MRIRIAALLLALLVAVQPAQVEAHRVVHWSAWQQFWVTGYADCCITATGTQVHWGELAVDPRVIPLGATVAIAGIGTFHAEDVGGFAGRWVDVYWPTVAECYSHTGWYRVRWRR